MGNENFIVFNDSGIKKSVSELMDESSKVKAELFQRFIMKKGINLATFNHFETYVNEFLKFWSDYAIELKGEIRKVKIDNCEEGSNIIDYGFMKEFIYGNFDFASVLQFADGVISGIKNGDMENPGSIDDFKDHTIDIAFNHQDTTTAGLLDSVLSDSLQAVSKDATVLDLKMFDASRNDTDIFKSRDRGELYTAICKVLQYISSTDDIASDADDYKRTRLFISMINNIVEYINYSLTIYAVRIYVMSKYAEPFIKCNHKEDDVLTESVSLTDISENPNGEVSSVFQNTDDLIIKDPKQGKELIDRIDKFLKLIGSGTIFDDKHNYDYFNFDKELKKGNKLYEKLKDNLLYDFFENNKWFRFDADREVGAAEMNHAIKTLLYISKPSAENSITPRNEFINIIRTVEYGTGVADYQKLARDLSIVIISLGGRISHALRDKSWQLGDELITGNMKLGARKDLAECIRFLIDIYEEIVFLFIQKAGYIERKINQLKSSNVKKAIEITSLNIPGLTSDISSEDSMMMAAPNTTRMISEDVDLYIRPVFESLQMYDAYLRSLPEFENDMYLKEVADVQPNSNDTLKDKIVDKAGTAISTVFNKLKALLQSLYARLEAFWNSKSFVLSRKWVIDNEEAIKNLQFPADAKLEILPYKDEITLPQGFSKLQQGLMAFNEDNVKSQDSLQKYLHTLYPNDQIAKWFADDTDGKTAAQQYMNLILFDEGSNQPKAPIVITGNDIAKKLLVWLNTVKGSDVTRAGFKKISDDINTAVGSINTKIVSITNQSNQAAANQAPDAASTDASAAAKADDPNAKQAQQSVNQQQAAPVSQAALLSDAGVRITSAITRLWSPVTPMILRAMMNQYGYIKTAYSLGQGASQTHTPEGTPQPQQKGQL